MKKLINRSFSFFRESDASEADDEHWFRFFSGSKNIFWSDLLKKRLVVILGEAGIGKTYEFENEVKILIDEAQFAFFLPLNLIDNPEGFDDALIDQHDLYEKWLKSDDPGYFFLDSVDEARLNSPIALQKALITTQKVLAPNLKRVSFYISSRITDWNIPEVQKVVRQYLLKPVVEAEGLDIFTKDSITQVAEFEEQVNVPTIDLQVFQLDPLSAEEAKKLAEEFGVNAIDEFWQQVEEGDYAFLATRPLDLYWMVARWNQSKSLGKYSELLEAAIINRLAETNPSYVMSRAVLSQEQLRKGVEYLAAACVFSNRAYIQISAGETGPRAITAADALPDWDPLEHLRLLGSAVFDEATYGRVKFHHRYVREYLAACWVDKQISAGLPINFALLLFIKYPYGQPVLLKSRRSVLCWLTTLNAKIRQRIIREFPELLMLEGDPLRWSTEDVVEAFEKYIKKLESGYKRDWWSDTSEVRRVARMLPPQLLIDHLNHDSKKPEVFAEILTLVKHGKVLACADNVFSIYCDDALSDRERHYVLITLAEIATSGIKASISDDLLSGKLKSNELISAALEVVGIENLDVAQLEKIFSITVPENEYGAGPMAMSVKLNLIPIMNFDSTVKLLSALLAALKTHDVKKLAKRAEVGKLPIGWILTILPDVLLHAVQMLEGSGAEAPCELINASLIVENLRHTSYANEEDFRQLRAEIALHAEFRKKLALSIALSKDNPFATSSLTWVFGLIQLSKADLNWLIKEAMRNDIEVKERQVWFEVARDIAFNLHGKERKQVFIALTSGVDAPVRESDIADLKKKRINSINMQRGWRHEDRERKEKKRVELEKSKGELLKDLDRIRNGDFNVIHWLVIHSVQRGNLDKYTKVGTGVIYRDFGPEIGEAFKEGLVKAWRQINIPNPADYLDNKMPWAGIIGLASVNYAFTKGLEITNLTTTDVTRMVQLSIWEHGKHEPWLDDLSNFFPDQVVTALMPWLEFELSLVEESHIRNTIDLVLNGPIVLKTAFLERSLVFLKEKKVPNEQLQQKLCRELIDIGLATKEFLKDIASDYLMKSAMASPPVFSSIWFKYWSTIDLPAAWQWFRENSANLTSDPIQLASMVGESFESMSWDKGLTGTIEEIRAISDLFKFLNSSLQINPCDSNETPWYSVRTVRDRIPGILANVRGEFAQEELQKLAAQYIGTPIGYWLLNKAFDHACAEAELNCEITPVELIHFGEVYTKDPHTERDLFDQVMARMEEIRESIENGPFSERGLFSSGIEEKHLQIWLAARLDDTPQRRFIPRFKVFREPEVDLGNKPDIEVSCSAGNICIEVKPLDASRVYSANSLTNTLKDQLVDKYLKGENSKHGVLVLFRLDKKKWQIPAMPGDSDFKGLLDYLKIQADRIKSENEKVDRLEVLGIDCVIDP